MPKIPHTTTIVRLGMIPLLAVAIIPPSSAATPGLTTLYNFTNLGDGGFPEAGLVLGNGGALFGTTSSGMSGWGSVFELVPSNGGATWTETTIYDFTGGADGGNPVAGLVIGKNNIMYGTTYSGGTHGYGAVFSVAPKTGGGWTQKVLYSFAGGTDGENPSAGLAIATNGVLYGTTYGGGSAGLGTVFELIPSVSGWSEKILYNFLGNTVTGQPDGANPLANLLLASNGSLYGTTYQGGQFTITNDPPTCTTSQPCTVDAWGTVFELTPKGAGVWAETILYTFTGGSDGGSPESGLTMGKSGALFGNAFWGGNTKACSEGDYPQGCGAVFELTPTQGSTTWTENVLYAFTGHSPDGAHPYGSLGISPTGELFGTTFSGGANVQTCFPEAYTGCGTIFYIKPPSTQGGKWTKNNLIAFPGTPGGGVPNGIALATGGNMYGTTIEGGTAGGYGTVFLVTP
jgi:uncharacterized repeat protein (TIGR03803 family)